MSLVETTGAAVDVAGSFAPVATFALDAADSGGRILQGYAAPTAGRLPCLVGLVAGSDLLSLAHATGYSKAAAGKQIRFGWCGFSLGALEAAVALGRGAEIRCGVTAKVLVAWSSSELEQILLEPTPKRVAVSGLRRYVKGLSGCATERQIEPFVQSFMDGRPMHEVLETLWAYFLRRIPSRAETDRVAAELPRECTADLLTQRVTASEEFRSGDGFPLPGPFDPDFPFGLDIL